MKAKLIKENNFYKLIQDNIILVKISTNESIDIHYSFGKLSIKNCQAIELGYDLCELAENEVRYMRRGDERLQRWYGFKYGFQKALEILGDKKFSEEDVISMIEKSRETGLTAQFLILTKQQTEWDVIIKTTCDGMVTGLCMPEVCNCNIIPKLDAENCLILSLI